MGDTELIREITIILKRLGSSCYWYGESTGDYDMESVGDEEFFAMAINDIMEKIYG